MKTTLLLLLSFISINTYALEFESQEKFNAHKELTLSALEKREEILREERACVEKAESIAEIKGCFTQAKQNRRIMDQELRPKIK